MNHRQSPRILATLALALALPAHGAGSVEPSARITVHADRPGAEISPALWGLFFEEINHAGDGGLYAEMIQNRSFEETLPVEGCTLEGEVCRAPVSPDYADGRTNHFTVPWKFPSPWPAWSMETNGPPAAMSLASDRPIHPKNVRYLRLNIPAGSSPRLLNEGYWGIHARAGVPCDFSCHARAADGFSGPIEVGIVGADGQTLASAITSPVADADWRRYTAALTPSATDAQARFFLRPLSRGQLDLDVVSLFPRDTFKGRPNGCRADLAQMLADLKPAFLRFPGGCVVEGATMENRYRWKDTIGDIAHRPGHWSLWGYRNIDGLGFHEFLQLCEDLGAQGMYVFNCGLSCTGRNGDFWPDERLPELIQDTLDAVEYALGPADSRWGAERAKKGHPEPFPLKYLEIGNENFGPLYEARYRIFARTLKEKWPGLTLICNVGLAEADVHDQHFYVAPPFFFENFHRYDTRPGPDQPPKVYVGEYAVNRDVGAGNLLAALAESAFMMGMERNGDYVIMASYAPLFYHVNDRRWPVNLIGFDNARCFGRASYYAQKMFAHNRPDTALACESTSPDLELPGPGGSVGVGTWATQAEFKDIRVTRGDKAIFASDPSKGVKPWRRPEGKWQSADGALRQTGTDRPARALVGDNTWRDYTLSLKARKISGVEGFLILFQTQRDNAKSWWNLGGWGNREHGLEIPGIDAPRVPGSIETGRWYDIRVELRGQSIRCFLDGQLVHDVTRRPLPSLYAGAGKTRGGDLILKAVNASPKPQNVQIDIIGTPIAGKASLSTLAHPDAEAENSLDQPRKIHPSDSSIDIPGPSFPHTLPPNSLSILRIPKGE